MEGNFWEKNFVNFKIPQLTMKYGTCLTPLIVEKYIYPKSFHSLPNWQVFSLESASCFATYSLAYLWQLLCYVPSHKHRLQVDPEVLYHQPILKNLGCVGQIFHPLLYFRLERNVVSADGEVLAWPQLHKTTPETERLKWGRPFY